MPNALSDYNFGARWFGPSGITGPEPSTPKSILNLPTAATIYSQFNRAAQTPIGAQSTAVASPPVTQMASAIEAFTSAAAGEQQTVEIGEESKGYFANTLTAIGGNIGQYVGQGVVVVLGFIFIAGGILLFPRAQQIVKAATK